ncbi:uncharacterized protein PGTG_15273 [Puccinia graminis f. sp. tritici CRL 75-36-700-3]|uniref:Uncharacterized protein n=1 Tax=Puccinia graminis f. sp. tritici (strain CRL 75-36-700-3 / race SCCL) TaxID=418459 RepID=E3KYN5_PUCGT|nr:uncharacterized protein PGTG_15273 [Puccinia graminis f. sp. tritici CRL 75-36-700-3]EFP89431.2 hypothetical protein PGTG_15273 [Puccinia graminis f. sp. tritici CRL 75-36-700-3]
MAPRTGFKRGSDYDDTASLDSQALRNLQKAHDGAIRKVVDFDIMAVFLMQEFDKHHIHKILEMVGAVFTEGSPPQTMLQNQINEAAKLVRHRIQAYADEIKVNPATKKPFCLRFPTLQSVISHSIKLEKQCELLPSDSMVILLDEGGICVGVGLPPKPASSNTVHIPTDVRAETTLNAFVSANVLEVNPNEEFGDGPDTNLPPMSPFPLSSNPKGLVRAAKEAKDSTCSFQAYGFGLGSPLSTGAADKKIPCLTHHIKTEELQGWGDAWRSDEEEEPHLPEPLRSETGATFRGLVELRCDTVYYSRVSYWINKIFLPKSSAVAELAIEFLSKNRSSAVKEAIERENNPIVAAYPGSHGFSFHGPFRIVFHGVSQFHFPEEVKQRRRYSVAMWSRASSFSAIARGVAHKAESEVFSDREYWLPVYPKYSYPKIVELLKAEVKTNKKARQLLQNR